MEPPAREGVPALPVLRVETWLLSPQRLQNPWESAYVWCGQGTNKVYYK